MSPIRFFNLAVLFLFWGCGHDNTAGGNSTETENAIALQIVDSHGQQMGNTAYRVLPLWFIGDTTQRMAYESYTYWGVSDSKGRVRIEQHVAGDYIIEVFNDSLLGVLHYSLTNDSVQTLRQVLSINKPGAIEGWIKLPDTAPFAWIFLYGMDRVARTDSTGYFHLDNLPPGNLTLIAIQSGSTVPLGLATFQILPEKTLRLDSIELPSVSDERIGAWKFSKEFNGASLVSEWMKPLSPQTVLTLRLDSTHLDFSELKSDGSDFRIFKSSGVQLPIRIAYWDSTFKKGIVQIKILDWSDTLDNWTLKWGNPYSLVLPSIDIWSGISDSLYFELNSVLVDDFEHGSSQNALLPPISSNSWYKSASEGATISPAKDEPFANALQNADSGRVGIAAHFEYSATYPKYALIGTKLTSGTRSLAHMDSLEVWMRGDGEYTVALENLEESDNWKTVYDGMNTPSWSRVVIRPQDFLPADSVGGNFGWESIQYSISTLTFFAKNGQNIWIDDIRIYGINRDDLK